jgi:galactonate dehydratase
LPDAGRSGHQAAGVSSLNSKAEIRNSKFETREGYWLKTEQPGLGVEVNEEEARKHPFQPEAMPTTSIRAADGAILDW